MMKAPEPLATSPKDMVPVMPLDWSRSGCEGVDVGGVKRQGGGAACRTCLRSLFRWRLDRGGEGAADDAASASAGSATKTAPCPTTQCCSALARCLSFLSCACALSLSTLTSSAKLFDVITDSNVAASWCLWRCSGALDFGPCRDCSQRQKLVASAISSAMVAIHGGAVSGCKLLFCNHCAPEPVAPSWVRSRGWLEGSICCDLRCRGLGWHGEARWGALFLRRERRGGSLLSRCFDELWLRHCQPT